MKANTITINTGNTPPDEYKENLHESITEVLKLAFVSDEMNLNEAQTFAIHVLNDFLQRLVKKE